MADTRRKVTIYSRGGFGNIVRIEARLIEHGRRKFAQYPDAPFVNFVPKRKRKARGMVVGYDPYFFILDGWDHPEPDGMFLPIDYSGVLPTQKGKYSSCDPGWVRDFEDKLGDYLTSDGVTLIADYRNGSPTETKAEPVSA